jgi:tRNA(Ile)-lysidine synthase
MHRIAHRMEHYTTALYLTSVSQIEPVVRHFFETQILPSNIQRIGVAVSGGADSVALFHLLTPLCQAAGIETVVLHLNHGLRPESDAEADFVRHLADTQKFKFHSRAAELLKHPRKNCSLEMAAREERLKFYFEASSANRLDAVTTGHHADDLCETVLLRMTRGSGIAGLSGLKPISTITSQHDQRKLTFYRPLLRISSSALRDWLNERRFTWHEDHSNQNCEIPRNNVRHCVMPFLRENLSPNINVSLCRSAESLRDDEAFLQEIAEGALASLQYNEALLIAALLKHPPAIQRRILRLWLFRNNSAHAAGLKTVDSILAHCRNTDTAYTMQLDKNRRLVTRGELLSIQSEIKRKRAASVELIIGGSIQWADYLIETSASRGIKFITHGIGNYPALCSLDAAKIAGRKLIVRSRKPGDRIAPTGFQGSRKIKDIMIDAKIPRHLRDTMPVIACGDEVIWIPGYRIARGYTLDSEDAAALRITITKS